MAPGSGAGGWEVSGVISVSLDKLRSVQRKRIFKQKSNYHELFSVIQAPCGSSERTDGYGGIWGHRGAPDMCTHTCMHSHA